MLTTGLAVLAMLPGQAGLTRESVIQSVMRPYTGGSITGVNRNTLTSKVMTGYQGWFATPGDGSDMGWFHWGEGARFDHQRCGVVMWPDVSELSPSERVQTSFRHADGSRAEVFSSYNRQTVLRHFRWMREYGIDGAFVQRFGVRLTKPVDLRFNTTVLDHCRAGANLNGRTYAVMYDLTAMKRGQMNIVKDDWKLLVDRMRITRDPAYLKHNGKPVVVVWGIGFVDGRQYTLNECYDLVKFLKHDPRYGGNTVIVGVPTYWRIQKHDAVRDTRLHDIVRLADIVSPWTVGRYRTPQEAATYVRDTMAGDLAWCRGNGKELLPVLFPGYSWKNMASTSVVEPVPRYGGQFLWTQYAEAKKAGASMIYQAMFDEVDEGTAIFKVTPSPPVGAVGFVPLDHQRSDTYLWLTGQAARMIRNQAPVRDIVPRR